MYTLEKQEIEKYQTQNKEEVFYLWHVVQSQPSSWLRKYNELKVV